MSTLVPGSEPWQIAEPLEYAADIWKALEEKYGPKSEGMDENDGDSFPEEGSVEKNGEHQWQDKLTGKKPPANNGLAQEVSDGLQEVAELWTREQEKDAVVINATNSQSTEEKKKWNSDSMRDQRFLWALLNGGKEDETGRTNRKADHG